MLLTFQSTVSRSPRRSCSSSRYWRHSSTSSASGVELAVVAHQHAEQVGHVLERGFGAPRVAAHQRQHGVDAVEQEMRPDARLQRLQPRLGDRRRQRAGAQMEVDEQRRRRRRSAEQRASAAASPAACGSSASHSANRAHAGQRRVTSATIAGADAIRQARQPRATPRQSTASTSSRYGSTTAGRARSTRAKRRGQLRLARERDHGRAAR